MKIQIQEFFREGRHRSVPGWFIGLCRIAFGLMWLYSASWKVPPFFGQETGSGLWYWVQQEIRHPAFRWYGSFLESVVMPHLALFGWVVFLLELCVGLSLLVGLFVRVFSALGVLVSLNLLIGLAAHPTEPAVTCIMMIMFHLLFITTSAGLNWGIDQVLLEKLANSPFRQTPWGKRMLKIL